MRMCAKIVEEAQPEVLDINFGCPVKKIALKGAGAGILCDLPKMEDLTREIVQATSLPVTVKTRLGWDESTIKIQEVALRLQDAGIKALTVHGRTRKQMYKGVARWDPIHEMASHPDIEIPIFGNGDVNSPEVALDMRNRYPQIKGAMIGRASIGNPWIFREIKHFFATGEHHAPPSLAERAQVCRRHLEMSVDWKPEIVAIREMRRHYANYFKGIPHFKETRIRLVTTDNLTEIYDILSQVEHMPDPYQTASATNVVP